MQVGPFMSFTNQNQRKEKNPVMCPLQIDKEDVSEDVDYIKSSIPGIENQLKNLGINDTPGAGPTSHFQVCKHRPHKLLCYLLVSTFSTRVMYCP